VASELPFRFGVTSVEAKQLNYKNNYDYCLYEKSTIMKPKTSKQVTPKQGL